MNKKEIIEKIEQEVPNFKKEDIKKIIDIFIREIGDQLKQDGKIKIKGLGTFFHRKRHARHAANPQNPNKLIKVPEVRVAKFRSSKILKRKLNKK